MKCFLILVIFMAIFSCGSSRYEYPNDPTVSLENGEPISDSIYYFPLERFVDSMGIAEDIEIEPDIFSVKWFSQDLWLSDEPVLYNYYLNRDIYRLTWLRSFHPSIVLRLENHNGDIVLIQKKMTLVEPLKEVSEARLTDEHREQLANGVASIMEYRPDSTIIESRIINISIADWQNFEKILNEQAFASMSTTRPWEFGTDGSEWILEQHKEDNYHVVNRWSPNENQYTHFRKIGDFLIDLSSYSKEERY